MEHSICIREQQRSLYADIGQWSTSSLNPKYQKNQGVKQQYEFGGWQLASYCSLDAFQELSAVRS
eukprot:12091019-Ditylum_brightwellii.AAC.1